LNKTDHENTKENRYNNWPWRRTTQLRLINDGSVATKDMYRKWRGLDAAKSLHFLLESNHRDLTSTILRSTDDIKHQYFVSKLNQRPH